MRRNRKKAQATRSSKRRSVATPIAPTTAVVQKPFDHSASYTEACRLASLGQHEDARRIYTDLENSLRGAVTDIRLRALVQNDLAVMAAMDGRFEEAFRYWHAALDIDANCLVAQLKLDPVAAEISLLQATDDFGELTFGRERSRGFLVIATKPPNRSKAIGSCGGEDAYLAGKCWASHRTRSSKTCSRPSSFRGSWSILG
jgi:tetratricopeptide (TPR) repeat protein